MNLARRKTAGWIWTLGLACSAWAAAQPLPAQERDMRGPPNKILRAPDSTGDWQAASPRVARIYRPWADPAARANMQRANHRPLYGDQMEMVPASQAEMLPVPRSGGTSGPAIEDGPPAVAGFHAGQQLGPMIDGDGSSMGCCNGGCDSCGGEGCDDCGCDDGCCQGKKICLCVDLCWFDNLQINAGVHGFKGPVDLGNNGNFGVQEGFNFGTPLPLLDCFGIGGQVGLQGVQSNFTNGVPPNANGFPRVGTNRNQLFFTTGVFHRSLCGLQWGVAWDYLRDNYWLQDMTMSQIRGEISLVGSRQNEIGFMFNHGLTSSTQNFPNRINTQVPFFTETWSVTDIYAGFYRHRWCNGADVRLYGGASGQGDGIVGADSHVPFGRCFALEAAVTYLIPRDGQTPAGAREEVWNLAINLVWYPFRTCGCPGADPCWGQQRPYRPLLNVADNGSFLVRRAGNLTPFLPQ